NFLSQTSATFCCMGRMGRRRSQVVGEDRSGNICQARDCQPAEGILVSVDQRIPVGLDLEEWAQLRRVLALIKECAPAGTSAGEVFQVIEEALRARYAKQIEPPGVPDGSR